MFFCKHIKMQHFVFVKLGICSNNESVMEYFHAGKHLHLLSIMSHKSPSRQQVPPFQRSNKKQLNTYPKLSGKWQRRDPIPATLSKLSFLTTIFSY